MNSPNALGFLVLGALMHVVPDVAPSFFSEVAAASVGSSSAIWMHFMSFVVAAIGGGHFVRQGVRRVPAVFAAWTPISLPSERAKQAEPGRLPSGVRA